ncbi:125b6c42-221d-44dd-bec0-b49d735a58d0 [Thermothielavioides terrestris]|uniref:125b6c42-221d-44dd-bec0-b49d735a58d0 n=1 Tax=Thermothielavioides terrestris TaxID=2587410 RepID=A0A3S4EUN8_9PEZI|nr:125b6c42-221d-44dd-bec0-b49d735a58d0 [Thermothielavioides terrestris]
MVEDLVVFSQLLGDNCAEVGFVGYEALLFLSDRKQVLEVRSQDVCGRWWTRNCRHWWIRLLCRQLDGWLRLLADELKKLLPHIEIPRVLFRNTHELFLHVDVISGGTVLLGVLSIRIAVISCGLAKFGLYPVDELRSGPIQCLEFGAFADGAWSCGRSRLGFLQQLLLTPQEQLRLENVLLQLIDQVPHARGRDSLVERDSSD